MTYSGFQLDEAHARNPVTLAKPGFSVPFLSTVSQYRFSVPHSYEKRYMPHAPCAMPYRLTNALNHRMEKES